MSVHYERVELLRNQEGCDSASRRNDKKDAFLSATRKVVLKIVLPWPSLVLSHLLEYLRYLPRYFVLGKVRFLTYD